MPRNPIEFGDMPVRQSRIPAAGATAPDTLAPRSVFEQAKQAKPVPAVRVDIAIRKGVSMPPPLGRNPGATLDALRRMEPGDSVELPIKQARGFYAGAKKFGRDSQPLRTYAFRRLSEQTAGVWRLT